MSQPVFLDGDSYLKLPRPSQTWLIQPLVPAGGSTLLYGDPKLGKSYLALQLALAIQEGKDFLGFPVRMNGPVAYLQLDTPRGLWLERLDALVKSGQAVNKLKHGDRQTLNIYPFDIMDAGSRDRLKAAIMSLAPVAVVVDTIRESHQQDEDKSTSMQAVVAALQEAVSPAALILVGHSKKPTTGQDGKRHSDLLNDSRGSGYLAGRMDTILRLTKHTLWLTGRSIEEGSLRLERDDNGFWINADAGADAMVSSIASEPGTMRSKAAALALKLGISEEAARMRLRRAGQV